jgi:hypothetical protein
VVRGLPHAYRAVGAPVSTAVQVDVTGPGGGTWRLERDPTAWCLNPSTTEAAAPAATVVLGPTTAWQLFTKGLPPEEARAQALVSGNEELVWPLLRFVAVMA